MKKNNNLFKSQANSCVLSEDSQYIVTELDIKHFLENHPADKFGFEELEDFTQDLCHEYDLDYVNLSLYTVIHSFILYRRTGKYIW